jgi:hypothetical protein
MVRSAVVTLCVATTSLGQFLTLEIVMAVFISYAREDRKRVIELRRDIERAYGDVWLDSRLVGGEDWWEEILDQIRSCNAFLLALSAASCRSEACMSEMQYALALHRPFVAVTVAPMNVAIAPLEVGRTQIVEGARRTVDTVVGVLEALRKARTETPLPDVLPEPPERPASYADPHRQRLAVPEGRLSLHEQDNLFRVLKADTETDEHRDEAIDLLRELAGRNDVYAKVNSNIAQLFTALNVNPESPSGGTKNLIVGDKRSVAGARRVPRSKAESRADTTSIVGTVDGGYDPPAPPRERGKTVVPAGHIELYIVSAGPNAEAVYGLLTAYGVKKEIARGAVRSVPTLLALRHPHDLADLLRKNGAEIEITWPD